MASAVTFQYSFFPAIADAFFPLFCSGTYRGAVTCKSQMLRVNKPVRNGFGKKLLVIKCKNKGKGMFRFYVPALKQRKKPGSNRGISTVKPVSQNYASATGSARVV